MTAINWSILSTGTEKFDHAEKIVLSSLCGVQRLVWLIYLLSLFVVYFSSRVSAMKVIG